MGRNRNRVLMIGQAPGKAGALPGTELVGGYTGERLRRAFGGTLWQYVRRFERRNLLREFPGAGPFGDRFPRTEAAEAARSIAPLLRGRKVLFVGIAVAQAFRLRGSPMTWHTDPTLGCEWAVLPHPSGRNPWWNSHENREQAARFLGALR